MKRKLVVAAIAAVVAACSKVPPPVPAPPPVSAAPAPAPAPAPAAEPAPAAPTPAKPQGEAAPRSAKPPAPVAKPVPAPESAHVKVGDAKCRMCHRLQHDSWSASPHAAKGLDCEGCHGGGADFVKVMRDRSAALAAGLMIPTKEFCKKCHKADWQDGMFLRVHAHKAK